jgi:hypothetical protein
MSTSEKTFNQVRAILSKLDRSIDEAREKRTQPAPSAPSAPQAQPQASRSAPPPSPNGSQYGRAQPMSRPQATNMLRWNQ